ncbi:MAG: glycosyl hydrolase 2 galactose-binding domain-containing protein [Acidimicrobiales bacterium]
MAHVPTRTAGRGSTAAVRSWQVQSSAVDQADEVSISRPDYRPSGWYDAPARSTVMAALLHNGLFGDVSYSTRLRDEVDPSMFGVPWWFRTTFRSVAGPGTHTTVCSDGIIPKADLWVNGARVAGQDVIAGAYTSNSFDISHLVRRGTNAIAYLVHPGSPMTDLSIGWVDWAQWPPDNNMGIWRDVLIRTTGPVRLSSPRVTVGLSPGLDTAHLVVTCDAANLCDERLVPEGRVTISGPTGAIELRGELTLGAGAAGTARELRMETELRDPALWWPAGFGDQPLYDLEMQASVDGRLSDRVVTTFGIRSLTSEIAPGGGRWFVLNGQTIPVRGAGWSPDLFLRHDPQRIADEIAYTLDVGLNTIRLEGKGENPEFFEMTDEAGVLVLAGWECCNKWEAHANTGGTPWDDHDFDVAARSMQAEAYRLANHPCVIGFVLGSDFPPEPRACRGYVEALVRARWDLPIISSATVTVTEECGPSGMKMTGPYAWVPPVYWYRSDPELGGAIGFNSETSAGNNVPRRPSLERMLSPAELEQLWSQPSAKQFHAGPPSEFDNLEIFHRALAARYGEPRSLRDFLAKAQLASYEATRAQFEAYGSRTHRSEPATGVVYWMLNSAWPSLNWQLWDHYLDPSGAYFGTKKANEPLHIQYDYGDRVVQVVNRTLATTGPLVVTAQVRSVDGVVVGSGRRELPCLGRGETVTVAELTVGPPDGVSGTYFLELALCAAGDGTVVSRNVYWLSSAADVLNLERTTWQYTPTAEFADLRGLERLAPPELAVTATSTRGSGRAHTSVTIRNASSAGVPALGIHASLQSHGGAPVAPVIWNENDLVLFAGQSATMTAEYGAASVADVPSWVEIDAFNLPGPLAVVID